MELLIITFDSRVVPEPDVNRMPVAGVVGPVIRLPLARQASAADKPIVLPLMTLLRMLELLAALMPVPVCVATQPSTNEPLNAPKPRKFPTAMQLKIRFWLP